MANFVFPRRHFAGFDNTIAVAVLLVLALAASRAHAGSGLKLNQAPLPGESVSRFEALPTGDGVVYQSGDSFSDPADIFIVPIGGGPSTLLSGAFARTYGSRGFIVAPNSDQILFWVNANGDANSQDLYRVPTTGGLPVPLIQREVVGQPSVTTLSPRGFDASGERLIYLADYADDSTNELYSIPTLGGTPQMISAPLNPGATVPNVAISPDRSHVVYGVSPTIGGRVDQLVGAAADGSAVATLADGVALSSLDSVGRVGFTPDGTQVVFDTGVGLYLNDVSGGTPRQLDLQSGRGYQTAISPDGQFVAFLNSVGLYSLPLSGGDAIPLSGRDTFSRLRGVSSDSAYILFDLPGTQTLGSVPITGGPAVQLSEAPVASALVVNSPDAPRAVYQHSSSSGNRDIYSVKVDGSERTQLNVPSAGKVSGDTPLITPDGRFVVFGIEKLGLREEGWYAVSIEGGEPVRITEPQYGNSAIWEARLTPDGSKLLYLADQDVLFQRELYVSGLPLAHVDEGAHVAGQVLGGVGFPGGLEFQFDHVGTAGTLTAEFFRTLVEDLDANLVGSPNFELPGDLLHLWDLSYAGTFSGSVLLTFTYDERLLGPGVSENALTVMHQLEGGGWEELATLDRNALANTITVEVQSFSYFTIAVVPEPTSFMLLSMAAASLLLCRRMQRRHSGGFASNSSN